MEAGRRALAPVRCRRAALLLSGGPGSPTRRRHRALHGTSARLRERSLSRVCDQAHGGRPEAQGEGRPRHRRARLRLRQRPRGGPRRALHQQRRGRRRAPDFRGVRAPRPSKEDRRRPHRSRRPDTRQRRRMGQGHRLDERQRPGSPTPRTLHGHRRLSLGRRHHPRRAAGTSHRLGGAVGRRAAAPQRAAPGVPAPHRRQALGPAVQQRRVDVSAHRALDLRRVWLRADRGVTVARSEARAFLSMPQQRARPSPGPAVHERAPCPAGDHGSGRPEPGRGDAPPAGDHHGDAGRMSAPTLPRHDDHSPSGA